MAATAVAKEAVAMAAARVVVGAMAVEKVAAVREGAMVVATRVGMKEATIVAVAKVRIMRGVDMTVARVVEEAMAVAAMAVAAMAKGCLHWGLSRTQTQSPNQSRSLAPLTAFACHRGHPLWRLC